MFPKYYENKKIQFIIFFSISQKVTGYKNSKPGSKTAKKNSKYL